MNQKIFKDKRIIFICPNFMGYNLAIKAEMEALGGHVLMLSDRPYNFIYDFFKNININLVRLYQRIIWYFKLRLINLSTYNILFVVRGEHIPNFVLDKIKKSGIQMVMYQWDSVKNCNYLDQRNYFDKITTFDRDDSEAYGFCYFPLFYRREYDLVKARNSEVKKALFVGTYQPERYKSILELNNKLDDIGISTNIKIRIPFYYYLKLWIKGVKLERKYLMFENLSFSAILELYSDSDIIVDIANVNQTGLTMRTIEALGAKKTLLTNNASIVNETFYNQNNIKLLSQSFSAKTFNDAHIPFSIEQQRIDNWIIKLIS